MTTAPPDIDDARPGRPDRRSWLAVMAVIAAMTVMRVIYACVIDLRTDEAYYWTWSKEHVSSFLDHPPMIAWFVQFGTAIFGDTNFGVRFAGIAAMLVTQLLLADLVWRVSRDRRAVVLAVLMPEAALYYGLLMAKVSPDVALIPFAVAMLWALVRLNESGDGRWWLAAGLFAGLALLSKLTAVMLMPAVLAFMLVPRWRRRWLTSPMPWLAALIAVLTFLPVLVWNAQHDWASFRFQLVRATATHPFSLRTVGEFIGLQFGLVGFILLPVVLCGVAMTAWRGYRRGDAVAILLSTCVIVPFGYFFWKSLTLRVGDTWPMFLWPAGFAAAAINVTMLSRENWPPWLVRSTPAFARAAVATGVAFVVLVFLYSVVCPFNFFGRRDPIGAEAGFGAVAERAQAALQKAGATWIATTDYRTYAMMRWYFNGRVPVIQINERGRFIGFRDPGMNLIAGHAGLYVAREPEQANPVWAATSAVRVPLDEVDRVWRGTVMDRYALQKLTGWTPQLSPPPQSPLFRWRVLAGEVREGLRPIPDGVASAQGEIDGESESRKAKQGERPHPTAGRQRRPAEIEAADIAQAETGRLGAAQAVFGIADRTPEAAAGSCADAAAGERRDPARGCRQFGRRRTVVARSR